MSNKLSALEEGKIIYSSELKNAGVGTKEIERRLYSFRDGWHYHEEWQKQQSQELLDCLKELYSYVKSLYEAKNADDFNAIFTIADTKLANTKSLIEKYSNQ